MNKKITPLLAGFLAAVMLSACGSNSKLDQFKEDVDSFCASVAELNEAINNIDAEADNAAELALAYLDDLDIQFQDFAKMDFPEEYDYLEGLADEAGEYMKEAVRSYHEAFGGEEYNENTAAYARENSARALKRIQVILNILQGNDPSAAGTTSEAANP